MGWDVLVGKFVDTYKSWLDTQEGRYQIKRDKQQEKAINTAEGGYILMNDLFTHIFETGLLSDDKKYQRLKEKVFKSRDQFNKYD